MSTAVSASHSAAVSFALPMSDWPVVHDEHEVLARRFNHLAPRIVELGCGNARTARHWLEHMPQAQYWGLEVDTIQHAKNLQAPHPRMQFVEAGAQAIPFDDSSFDLALMLKSLHHVPMPLMDQALNEVARVLKPGAWLYVSEPVYDGALNELVRVYNDEGAVRAAAQAAVDRALQAPNGVWEEVQQERFVMPVRFENFDEFEKRMMRPTFANHHIDDAVLNRVRKLYEPYQTPQGALFVRPMHVRWLRTKA
ncbi:MAG: hypothetical protein RLZZ397_1041 [Pseudomonadota bacterium]